MFGICDGMGNIMVKIHLLTAMLVSHFSTRQKGSDLSVDEIMDHLAAQEDFVEHHFLSS